MRGLLFYHNVIIDLRYSVIYMHSTRHACEIIEQVSTLKDTAIWQIPIFSYFPRFRISYTSDLEVFSVPGKLNFERIKRVLKRE